MERGMVQIMWGGPQEMPSCRRNTQPFVKYFTVDKISPKCYSLWSSQLPMESCSQRDMSGCLQGISWTPRASCEHPWLFACLRESTKKEECLSSQWRRLNLTPPDDSKSISWGYTPPLKRLRGQNMGWTGDSRYMILSGSFLLKNAWSKYDHINICQSNKNPHESRNICLLGFQPYPQPQNGSQLIVVESINMLNLDAENMRVCCIFFSISVWFKIFYNYFCSIVVSFIYFFHCCLKWNLSA